MIVFRLSIIFTEIPITTSTLPNVSIAREGTNLTLQCLIVMTTPMPSITWLFNGAVVQASTEDYTFNANASSEGIYQCLVEAPFVVSTNCIGIPPTYSFISTTFVDTFCKNNSCLIRCTYEYTYVDDKLIYVIRSN